MPKKSERRKLIEKLDRIFSHFIRLSHADQNGYLKCFTCGKIGHWKNFDCGHFIKRQYLATRYSERNCKSQCKKCNYLLQGNDKIFHDNLDKLYGQGTAELLKIKSKNKSNLDVHILNIMIKSYTKKVNKLKENII